jgi:hypothetical protein
MGSFHFGRWDIAAVLVEAAVVNQSTHWAVASSTCSMLRQGLRGLISSVFYRPWIVSASALSAADRPDRRLDPGFGFGDVLVRRLGCDDLWPGDVMCV